VDSASLTLPEREAFELTPLHEAVVQALGGGGAYFFRQLADSAGALLAAATDGAGPGDKELEAALWDLVWAGRVGNDTLAPLRSLTSTGTTAHRSRRRPPRARYGSRRPTLP